ncbi:MAG: AAA family ATPase, partial [Candidatus Methanomethylophilaceae archaeon]|nr:AAA family ATPase [Candidatus Methanomethylophilaceae archaeon]
MKQVAIYGKGGIGKSTASANISYLLSKKGLKVAQIGCDPKHDSTRLLLGGKTQLTILDYLGSESGKDGKDVISKGKNGVICMETGGPEPGVGCAGRGILTAFDFIKENSKVPEDTDVVIYDVLGDVVCGGFAVPLRKQYANVVFIVTSGEFMSLYAANNVLKGIRNFDNGDSRLAGLILNSRGNENEYAYVKNFADAVGLPIVATIPRSKLFSTAESNGMTVSEMFPDSEETRSYGAVVDVIENEVKGVSALHPASP